MEARRGGHDERVRRDQHLKRRAIAAPSRQHRAQADRCSRTVRHGERTTKGQRARGWRLPDPLREFGSARRRRSRGAHRGARPEPPADREQQLPAHPRRRAGEAHRLVHRGRAARDVAGPDHRLRGHDDGEFGRRTRHRTASVGDDHRVETGIGRSHCRERKHRERRAGDGRTVLLPAIGKRAGAAHRRRKTRHPTGDHSAGRRRYRDRRNGGRAGERHRGHRAHRRAHHSAQIKGRDRHDGDAEKIRGGGRGIARRLARARNRGGHRRPGRSVGGGFDPVGGTFDGTPVERDPGARRRSRDDDRRGRTAADVFCHRLGDGEDGTAGGAAVVPPADHVGKLGRAISLDRHEVGVGAGGKLGRHAEAAVVEIEVEVAALRPAEFAQIVVVFEVAAESVVRVDRGPLEIGGEGRGAVLRAGGPDGERGAAGGCEISRRVGAVPPDVTGHHAAHGARPVERTRVPVGPIHGMAVGQPTEDG